MYIFNALPTSFPGFSPTCPTERERETLGKNPGNEVTRRSKIRPTLNSIRQTDVDTLMIRTQSRVRVRVRVRVIYLNKTGILSSKVASCGYNLVVT